MRSNRMKEKLVEGSEWTVAPDGLFVCPCGRRVEDDGQCPDGHVSPLRQMGMI